MRFFTLQSQNYKRNLNASSIKALKLFLLNIFQSSMKMDRKGMFPHIRILFFFKGALPLIQLNTEGGKGGQGNHLSSPKKCSGSFQETLEALCGVFTREVEKQAGPAC